MEQTEEAAPQNVSWLTEHSSAVAVISLATCGAVLYFFSSMARDTVAKHIGLAGAPGPVSLQQTMTDGAVILSGEVLPNLVVVLAGLFFALILIVLIFSLVAKDRFETWTQRDTKTGRYKGPWNTVCAILLVPLTFYVAFQSAHSVGLRAVIAIYEDLAGRCERCEVYQTGQESFLGIAALQTDTNIYVVGIEGTAAIPLSAGLIIRHPSTAEKEAKRVIPEETTRGVSAQR